MNPNNVIHPSTTNKIKTKTNPNQSILNKHKNRRNAVNTQNIRTTKSINNNKENQNNINSNKSSNYNHNNHKISKPLNTTNTNTNTKTLNVSKQQKHGHGHGQNKISKPRNRGHIPQRKTSISRANFYNANNNATERRSRPNNNNNHKSKSSSITPKEKNQSTIDQYSLQLQIKNVECETLKNELREIKKENESLKLENEKHKYCSTEILRLQQIENKQSNRIIKLEHKLESCGIDPIALKSPQFMNQDVQKNIIFWRERLFKARQKLNDRKIKQQKILQTAKYYINQIAINE